MLQYKSESAEGAGEESPASPIGQGNTVSEQKKSHIHLLSQSTTLLPQSTLLGLDKQDFKLNYDTKLNYDVYFTFY